MNNHRRTGDVVRPLAENSECRSLPLYVVVSEVTLPRVLWRALAGKPTCVVSVRSLGGSTSRALLARVVSRLAAWSLITRLSDHPELLDYPDPIDLMRLEDVFAAAEPWLDEELDLGSAAARFADYAIAFQHIVCNHSFDWYLTAARLYGVARRLGGPVRVAGLEPVIDSYYRWRYGTTDLCPEGGEAGCLFKLAWSLAALASTVAWIGRRLRVRLPEPRTVFLASEYIGGERETRLWAEVLEDRLGDLLVLFRNSEFAATCPQGPWHRAVTGRDGAFDLRGGMVALAETVRDLFRIWRRGRHLPAEVFRELALQPYRRMTFRGVFNIWRPRYVWSRDEYNAEHAIRTQEIRRVGGQSFGLLHGIPAICTVIHQLRYLDFDVFYVVGVGQHDAYRGRWPAHMRVRPVGTSGIPRQRIREVARSGGRDVFCTLGAGFHSERIMRCFLDIAAAFPDRAVLVNYKVKDWPAEFVKMVHRLAEEGPVNLRLDQRSAYDVLETCGYVVTMGSTLTAEGIQLGRVGLVLDIDERYKGLSYRRLPDICARSAQEAIARIRAFEAGEWQYPWAACADLVDLSGRCAWDAFRVDMGLPERDPELLPHPVRGDSPAAFRTAS